MKYNVLFALELMNIYIIKNKITYLTKCIYVKKYE